MPAAWENAVAGKAASKSISPKRRKGGSARTIEARSANAVGIDFVVCVMPSPAFLESLRLAISSPLPHNEAVEKVFS